MVTRIAVLGSTGSVGRQTLQVLPSRCRSACRWWRLAAGRNTDLLNEQIRRFRPALVSVSHAERSAKQLITPMS